MAEKLPDFISTHWQKVNQVSATLPEMPHKLQLLLRDSRWLTGWLTDNDRLIDWLNKTHFSIPDRGLMARTVFWVLCSSSTSSLSSSSSPQRLQPTAEQMYRSWDERNERGGGLQRRLFYCVNVVRTSLCWPLSKDICYDDFNSLSQ